MSVEALKKNVGYEFECNMDKSYGDQDANYFDEWGCAFVWLGEDIGVEYNFCIDNSTDEKINSSAIYKMELDKTTGYMVTDTSTFEHYEIDFGDEDWKEKLEDAMCKALIQFFELDKTLEYTLNYVNKCGDTIARDYFDDIEKANDFMDKMIETYKHYNEDKGLILYDDDGKMVRCYEPELIEEKEVSVKNTKITYLYRDAANYKEHNECIIKGSLNEEQKKSIIDCLYCGEWFIPSQVGLPEQKMEDYDPELDHPWFELAEDDFKETDEKPTIDFSVEDLVAAFQKRKNKWDEFSWLNDMDIKSVPNDLEEEIGASVSLEEKIQEANVRQETGTSKEKVPVKDEISM